ncbi:hypothetical protein [Sphingomonas nostoxanthinifaciens]|nr:hypothetical protein [Sphingomonas nostoxanthinifaciens]UAK26388.1 hypothetical protein K8P63_10035 [Sphingomonas nostoxanthinifaciens]
MASQPLTPEIPTEAPMDDPIPTPTDPIPPEPSDPVSVPGTAPSDW